MLLAAFGASPAGFLAFFVADAYAAGREAPWLGLLVFGWLLVAGLWFALYCFSQAVRWTPRLEMDAEGFRYRGAVFQIRSSWSNVKDVRPGGNRLLTFMQVRLADRPKPFGLYTALDLSGLASAFEVESHFRAALNRNKSIEHAAP
jgi:hypothetical protein